MLLVSSDADAAEYGGDSLSHFASRGVVCDLTAFGSTGPLRGQPATDAQVQAQSGVMKSTGLAGGPPMAIALPLIEQLAGIYAASGVLAALRRPRGQAVEIALYDVAFSAMTSFLAPALGGTADEISRVGNRHTMAAPWNVYRASDGWVLLCAGNDEQWQRICGLTGDPERGLAQRLAKNAGRVAHVDQVDALVQAWVGEFTIAQCVESLSALGIPCGPVAPIDGFPQEANLLHRAMIFEALGPSGRAIHLPGSPFRMSRSPGQPLLRLSAPDADREQVLGLLRGPRRFSDAANSDPSASSAR